MNEAPTKTTTISKCLIVFLVLFLDTPVNPILLPLKVVPYFIETWSIFRNFCNVVVYSSRLHRLQLQEKDC